MPSNWPAVIYNSNLTCSCALRVAAARLDPPPMLVCAQSLYPMGKWINERDAC
jgi:hypothetical protein